MPSSSKQLAIILGALALISLGLYAFLFYYILSHHTAIGSLEQGLVAEKAKHETLQADKRLYEDFVSAKEEFVDYFVAKEGEVAFIENVETIGKEGNVILEVQSLTKKPLSKPENPKWELLALQIRARGTWNDLAKTLSLIETLPMRVDVKNVTITNTEPGSELGVPSKTKKAAQWEVAFGLEALKAK